MDKDDKKKFYNIQSELQLALSVARHARNKDLSELLIKYGNNKQVTTIWANMVDACVLMDNAILAIDELVQLNEPNKKEVE